ncbi:MAG: PIN domain nuclease [Anaerolineae bacterium]|nr:PIN domain nuclease [Anaerolineae bacterium]
MLLVDSSVWIDYFVGRMTPETDYLDAILPLEIILVGDLILAEVLQGFRSDQQFQLAREKLNAFIQVSMLNPELAVRSASNFRYLRRHGITVRSTVDCIIATYAIHNNHELLHSDRDFTSFERYLGLRVVHPENG